jgi:hypothetical protein
MCVWGRRGESSAPHEPGGCAGLLRKPHVEAHCGGVALAGAWHALSGIKPAVRSCDSVACAEQYSSLAAFLSATRTPVTTVTRVHTPVAHGAHTSAHNKQLQPCGRPSARLTHTHTHTHMQAWDSSTRALQSASSCDRSRGALSWRRVSQATMHNANALCGTQMCARHYKVCMQ